MEGENDKLLDVDEGRKRVLLIAASILAARRLAQYRSEAQVPARMSAITDAIKWAERIMDEKHIEPFTVTRRELSSEPFHPRTHEWNSSGQRRIDAAR